MTERFEPKLEVLPPAQRRVWDLLGSVPEPFVLYGGTAVALYLGHRQSVDFDFFSQQAFDPAALRTSLAWMDHGAILQQAPSTLTVLVDQGGPVRVSFFGLPNLRRLRAPLEAAESRIQVASLLDLAGTKVELVQRRAEEKDYIDIDAILVDGRVTLPMALAAAVGIHGSRFNPQISLKALSYFGDGTLPQLAAPIRQRLLTAVRKVDLDRLPKVL